ncbi:hypothetical protein F5Y03DRAFT_382680 [Xylaria venustula]|nr:hypothetical protein F5Y03DRAFT_382680 [Xylaria venustula]
MGSLPPAAHYPDASDPSLILTHPTPAEQEQTWRLNHREWGGPLDLPAYLQREPFLVSTPLAADGGMVHWILTEPETTARSQPRRVLASCETIRKRVLYVPRDGGDEVREGLGYGIGSVYTYPEFRGKKYAARMLQELGAVLKRWPEEEQQQRKKKVCSALWSDIGKRFYASKGWPVFASAHVEFPSSSPSSPPGVSSLLEQSEQPHGTALTLAPVNTSNIAQLCREDEARLRGELPRRARDTRRTAFAFAPDSDVFRWHWAREEFIAARVFPGREASEVRGLIVTVTSSTDGVTQGRAATAGDDTKDGKGGEEEKEKRTRMWAIWTRNYGADAASNAAKNTLYILRLVIDDDSSGNDGTSSSSSSSAAAAADPKALQLAFDAILHGALDAARAWNCGSVHLWNPTSAVRDLIAGSKVAHKFVDRETDSIPSMMWYGPGENKNKNENEDAVEWVANEKYCWC